MPGRLGAEAYQATRQPPPSKNLTVARRPTLTDIDKNLGMYTKWSNPFDRIVNTIGDGWDAMPPTHDALPGVSVMADGRSAAGLVRVPCATTHPPKHR